MSHRADGLNDIFEHNVEIESGQVEVTPVKAKDIVNKEYVDNNFSPINNSIPIGCAIGWFKSFTGMPALPVNWVEFNGQTISDARSTVYNGKAVPNLNGYGGGTKRFLRGSTTSGTTGGTESHNHVIGCITTCNTNSLECVHFAECLDYTQNLAGCHDHNIPCLCTDIVDNLPSFYEIVWVGRAW
jgi:hypothetical protein